MTGSSEARRPGLAGANSRRKWDYFSEDIMMKKEFFRADEASGLARPKRIKYIQFSTLSGAEMEKASELHVCNKQLYDITTRGAVQFGCLDPRLGVCDKSSQCATCGMKLENCSGHFGHIKLELPVFHIGFYKAIQAVLSTICKSCGAVLMKKDEKQKYIEKMRSPKIDSITKEAIRKKIVDLCKKMQVCLECGSFNGTVKRVTGSDTLKLVHEKYKVKSFVQDPSAVSYRKELFAVAQQHNVDIDDALIVKMQENLNPSMVRSLFMKIKDSDLPILWADPSFSRPENMILTHLLVPPVAIRPSVKMDTQGTNEDDLTGKLQEILDVNNELANNLRSGVKMKKIVEHWNILQIRVSQFINSELPGLPAPIRRELKSIRGLVQRLKGKQGRFRGNLSGKRVDFSGRTVISPDPNLSVHQVGIPVEMAKKLTYPETVNKHNIDRLRETVKRGPNCHPGANFVRSMETPTGATSSQRDNAFGKDVDGAGLLRSLAFANVNFVAKNLKIGDIVERHLHDDDIVLFNRQPSLHKMSIMSHRAKVLPGRTLRFNECVCAPYNADFDGDEMNLHLPQTEESRAEADGLMGVERNIITPRNGEPLVTATQDFITAAYLMTSRDRFLTRTQFCQIVSVVGDACEHIDIPMPAILHPRQLWTGKQVWNVLLQPNKCTKDQGRVSFETKERSYSGNGAMCAAEGFVIFKDSELLCGTLGKSTLGGSKSGLLYALIRDYGERAATRVMNRMTKVCSRWLSSHGFSIGLEDVTPDSALLSGRAAEINEGYETCRSLISQFSAGTLVARPGCNAEESLESELSGVLSRVRDSSGRMCMDTLPRHNAAYVMATAGSKGSALNICQMMVCVGQQIVGGKRMPDGFVRRTLPHFDLDAKEPGAKGFVANSFYSGLTAPEFFFHTMGGREGLVDTAVKTAETGYMARRLMKALEDLSVRYDGTVRNASDGVVQFVYGDDGLNPSLMDINDHPVSFEQIEKSVKPRFPDRLGFGLSPFGVSQLKDSQYGDWPSICHTVKIPAATLRKEGKGLSHFLQSIHEYFRNVGESIRDHAIKLGISLEEIDQPRTYNPLSDSVSIESFRKKQRIKRSKGKSPSQQEISEMQWIALNSCYRYTEQQMREIIAHCVRRFSLSQVEPGEAVGAIGAQSLGEPGTQMTLKTFHFAGVASMNVTLGVPRIKEIINASDMISTPIITVKLQKDDDERVARIVKGRLESTQLGVISESMTERYTGERCMIVIKLATQAIEKLHLDVDEETVRTAILNHKLLKLKDPSSVTISPGHVTVIIDPAHRVAAGRSSSSTASLTTEGDGKPNSVSLLYFNVQSVKRMLLNVIVQGIPTIGRAVINRDEADDSKFQLVVEGLGLQAVMGIPGVDGAQTTTNHIMEMEKVLGIEAARELVMREVKYIFSRYGLSIDTRHLKLLADVMSYRGQILGITRFGIAKMKESVLMLASFEKTADHLFDAACHTRRDSIEGVSECIILGTPVSLGTGMFKLLNKWEVEDTPTKQMKPRQELLLESY